MEKIFLDLMAVTDDQEILETTQQTREKAYNELVKSLQLVQEAQKVCQKARERGEASPLLERVEALLSVAING